MASPSSSGQHPDGEASQGCGPVLFIGFFVMVALVLMICFIVVVAALA